MIRRAHTHSRLRCLAGTTIWHSNPTCSRWPTTVYAAESTIPRSGTFCAECGEHIHVRP